MMKITYLIAQGGFYGSEKHFFELVCYMKQKRAIQCILFSGGPLEEKLRSENIDFLVINDPSWLLKPRSIKKIVNEIRSFSPQLLHAHQPRATFWGMLFARFIGVPGIATIHSNPEGHAVNYSGFKAKTTFLFHVAIRYLTTLLAVRTIFVSKDSLQRSGVKNGVVIYNWLSQVSPPKKEPGLLARDQRRYICVCSITRAKGIYELVDFFLKVRIHNNNVSLDIVGWGSDKDVADFVRYIEARSAERYISLLGYRSDVSSLLDGYDAFICLTHDESFGLVFIEAMAKGLPVIASDIPVLREIVHPCNFFVNLSSLECSDFEKLVKGDSYSSMGQKNIQWVSDRFLYPSQMEKVCDLYEEFANIPVGNSSTENASIVKG